MAKSDSKMCFITDRGPLDSSPVSWWLWQEILDLAKSGKQVQVQLLSAKEIPVNYHHANIHIVPGKIVHPRLLAQWAPQCVHLIEPEEEPITSKLQWMLNAVLIQSLKQSGLIHSELAVTFFSSHFHWAPFADRVYYSHRHFPQRTLPTQARLEPIEIQTHTVSPDFHWCLQDLEERIVIPANLFEMGESAHDFLENAKQVLVQKPWIKFIFLKGFGPSSRRHRELFLNSDCSAQFIFPENLSGPQILYALKKAREIWTQGLKPHSSLMGVALQIQSTQSHEQLQSRSVYGLL